MYNKSNHNNRRNNSLRSGAYVNTDRIYYDLKSAIQDRASAQESQKELWRVIKSSRSNRSAQMDAIDKRIGNATHRINNLINQLCACKQYNKAMQMAHDYLRTEIQRVSKIIDRRVHLANQVYFGRTYYITADGSRTSDYTSDYGYIDQKRRQLSQLQSWDKYISRFL